MGIGDRFYSSNGNNSINRSIFISKRAQSLSINTVILLTLGLIVLVVLAVMILNNSTKFSNTTECEYQKNVVCPTSTDCRSLDRSSSQYNECISTCSSSYCENNKE